MMPLNLFRLQIMESFAKPARSVVRLGVTVLLALPFIFVNMPAVVKASGLVMVILFTTFFGTAIAHTRLCEDGRFTRLRMLPMSPLILWLDLVLALGINRFVPAALLLTGFIIINSPGINTVSMIYIASLLSMVILLVVSLATLIGHIARSNGQVHLLGALACGIIAFVSGLIPTVPIASLAIILNANPLYQLQVALNSLINGTLTVSTTALTLASAVLILLGLGVMLRWVAGSIELITQKN
jgi:hypothetical protein